MIRWIAFWVMTGTALASCATAQQAAAPAPAPAPAIPVAAPSTAARLADALAQADLAASSNTPGDLTKPLAIIASLGARPLDDATAKELALWNSRNPDRTPPMRGRSLGPGYRHGTLLAGGDLRIEQTFLSGQKASIALSSPNGAKLRLQVRDGTAQPVCQHVAERPSCAWVPMYTQRHVIHLVNPGKQNTRFYLVID